MILRKPYAFLIKHFRLIHGVLTLLLSFILYSTSNLQEFFKEYIKASRNLKLYIEPAIKSIPFSIYFAIIISLTIFGIIFVLMNKKEKPVKYYLFSLGFYFLFILALLFGASQISAIIRGNANLQLVSAVRDILQLFYFGQYIFIFISLFRTLGFNIKSFDFRSDLKDLNISEEDSEEFELGVALDSDDVKTRFRKNFRMFKYFVLENKSVFIIITFVLCLILIVSSILNVEVYNKVYKQGEWFDAYGLNMRILNTYETTKNYLEGENSSKNYVYNIVEFEVKNDSLESKSFRLDNIRMKVSEYDYYDISLKDNTSFFNVGVGYSNQVIKVGSSQRYIIVFKVDKLDNKNKKTLSLLQGYGNGGFVYTNVKLDTKDISNLKIKDKSKLKETLKIKDNLIGDISVLIDEYTIGAVMQYKYEETVNGKKQTFTDIIQPAQSGSYNKLILRLKSTINYNVDDSNKWITKEFFSKFGQIRYLKNNKEFENPFKLSDITPANDKQYTYLEISSDVNDASEIYLDITIRGSRYSYRLK